MVRELLTRVDSWPDIESAGAVHLRPLALGAIGADATVVLEGQPNERRSARLNPGVNYQSATPEYFTAMRIRAQQGRLFDQRDDHARHASWLSARARRECCGHTRIPSVKSCRCPRCHRASLRRAGVLSLGLSPTSGIVGSTRCGLISTNPLHNRVHGRRI